MSNNIDLVEKLKDCPKGTKLYSTIYGEVQLFEVKESDKYYPIITVKNNLNQTFTKDGRPIIEHKDAECVLFPSKDQRDWNKWECSYSKNPKFDPKTLKPFDKVLVRDSGKYTWRCAFYSHTREDGSRWKYVTDNSAYEYCIPYNDETKHLVGKTDEAPEYYRYWED